METDPDRAKDFEPVPLICKVKRESPATKAQKERLTKLLALHQLTPDYDFHADEKRGKPSDRPDSCGIWKLAKVREVLYNVWKRSHGRWCFNAICQML